MVRLPIDNVRMRGPAMFAGRAKITVTGRVVEIRAPVAPNDGIVEFRASLDGEVLSGVAEVHVPEPGMRGLHSIGRLELRRADRGTTAPPPDATRNAATH